MKGKGKRGGETEYPVANTSASLIEFYTSFILSIVSMFTFLPDIVETNLS